MISIKLFYSQFLLIIIYKEEFLYRDFLYSNFSKLQTYK